MRAEFATVAAADLRESPWVATHILRPDLLTLSSSLYSFGVLSPIVVRRQTMEIVDGHQRHRLVTQNPHVRESVGPLVPVALVDCSETQAMMLHLQMNRGRGELVTKRVSGIVRRLKMARAYSADDFDAMLSMKVDELELLLEGSLVRQRNLAQHTYSRAWVPVEVAGMAEETAPIEGPPNGDR